VVEEVVAAEVEVEAVADEAVADEEVVDEAAAAVIAEEEEVVVAEEVETVVIVEEEEEEEVVVVVVVVVIVEDEEAVVVVIAAAAEVAVIQTPRFLKSFSFRPTSRFRNILIYVRLRNIMPVENPKQTAIEENILKKMNELSLKTKDSFRMPVRPGYCTLGTGAWVRANFFPVKLPTGNIYKYDVKIEPAVKNARKAKRLYEILENHDAFNQYASCTATDYSKTIVSLKPLNPKASTTAAGEKDDHVEIKVIYTELDGEPLPPEGKGEYKFIIQRTNCIVPGDFGDYVAGRRPDYNAGEAIQALNVILAKFPSKSLTMVSAGKNRSKFFILSDNPSLTCDLGGGLVALRGFYTSIRPSVGNILCNVNVCTAAFYA
jgi:hypothetical protein